MRYINFCLVLSSISCVSLVYASSSERTSDFTSSTQAYPLRDAYIRNTPPARLAKIEEILDGIQVLNRRQEEAEVKASFKISQSYAADLKKLIDGAQARQTTSLLSPTRDGSFPRTPSLPSSIVRSTSYDSTGIDGHRDSDLIPLRSELSRQQSALNRSLLQTVQELSAHVEELERQLAEERAQKSDSYPSTHPTTSPLRPSSRITSSPARTYPQGDSTDSSPASFSLHDSAPPPLAKSLLSPKPAAMRRDRFDSVSDTSPLSTPSATLTPLTPMEAAKPVSPTPTRASVPVIKTQQSSPLQRGSSVPRRQSYR